MSLIHNERRKLTATALNGVAIGTMVAGSIAPLIAVSYGVSGAQSGWYFGVIGFGLVFHGHRITSSRVDRAREA
jgi:hypothetical protein